jgi:valyl-tRNA synthetase
LFQGLIDLSKEEERIQKKVSLTEQQLSKLREATSKADYAEKVPKEVQDSNSTKLKAWEGEIKELGEAMAAVKLMLTEQ